MNIKKAAAVLILLLIFATVIPFSACTAGDEVSDITAGDDVSDIAKEDDVSVIEAGEDVIMSFYEQHREYAASLGIAMIENGNTEFYYLGDIENNPDYVFDWGSCTKVITWVSVMQLVEQGKLDLNADIRTCLPEGFLTRLKYDEPITMLNLMNHDAGFQDMSADLFTEDKSKIPTLAEALKKNQPPQTMKPGDVVAYSNFGAALAGYIVECVSGQDYGDYVISNIFGPLGMVHTSIKDDHSDNLWVENQWLSEKCYFIAREGEKTELGVGSGVFGRNPLMYGIYAPAGSACGTIEDFSKFTAALIPDENSKCPLFEKDSTLTEMFKPTLYYDEGTPRNAHGMWAQQIGNGLFGHGGNSTGFSSNFMIDPAAKKAYAVMTNVVGEVTFCDALPPLIFGDYDWGGKDFTACDDISGKYNGMRGYVPHGFMKITGFLDCLPIEKTEWDNVYYLFGDEDLVLRQISDRVYNIDGRIDFHFVGDDGVLQNGTNDYHRKSDAGYYAEQTLYNLCYVSFFCAIGLLFINGIVFIIKKIRKHEIVKAPREKYHLLSLGCSAAVVLLLIIAVNTDISTSTIAVFGVLATISAIAAFVFGILQVRIDNARLLTKIFRVITLVISTALLINVFYWEFFNFWSV